MAAAVGCAHAQSIKALDPVVVTASRFEDLFDPAVDNLRIISREQIDRYGANSIPEALNRLAGVNVRGTSLGQLGLNATVDIGGFGVTGPGNTLILLDGVRLNPIDSAEISWAFVPISQVERIEVLDGAASVQFGAGATGGVVNIVSRAATTQRNAVLNTGSFGTVNLSGTTPIGSLGTLTLGSSHSDGWRDNSQAEAHHISVNKNVALGSDAALSLRVFGGKSATAMPGGVVGLAGTGDSKSAKFNNVDSQSLLDLAGFNASGSSNLNERVAAFLTVGYVKRRSEFRQPYNDSALSVDPVTFGGLIGGPAQTWLSSYELSVAPRLKITWNNNSSTAVGADVTSAEQKGHNRFGADAQAVILANRAGAYHNNIVSDMTDVKALNRSVYLSHVSTLSDTTSLRFGFRRQLQSVNLWDLNKSTVGGTQTAEGVTGANAAEGLVSHPFGDRHTGFFKVSQSFRFANTDEFWAFDQTSNRVFSGLLRPQKTRALEVGGTYQYRGSAARFSITDSVTRDEIRYNPTNFRNSNLADDIHRRQVSLSASTRIETSSTASISYRYLDATFANGEYAGSRVGLIPRHLTSLNLSQVLGSHSILSISSSFTGRQTYDASPSSAASKTEMPSYVVTDVFVRHRSETGVYFSAGVKNLFDKRYSTYGGFGYVITGNNAAGASSYYYFPSDPRAFYLSVQADF
jgi:iron complex outermembrane receptor protein